MGVLKVVRLYHAVIMENVYSPRIVETDGVPVTAQQQKLQEVTSASKPSTSADPTMKESNGIFPSHGGGSKTSPSPPSTGGTDEQVDQFLRQLFGSCGGMVDAAVFLFQATCRGQEGKEDAANQGGEQHQFLRMPNRRRAYPTPGGTRAKRQGETLEFPTQGGFDDDVSALSAHTLEEMERNNVISRAMKNRFPPTMGQTLGRVWGRTYNAPASSPQHQQKGVLGGSETGVGGFPREHPIISPPATTAPSSNLPWTFQVVGLARQGSDASKSIGISTSGSSDEEQQKQNGDTHPTQDELTYTRVVV